MKIEETQVRRLTISEVAGLDPITVIAEDLAPSKGTVTISCYGKSWTAYWGGIGGRTIAQFFCICTDDYLAGELSNIPAHVFEADALVDKARKAILFDRRWRDISHATACERYDDAGRLSDIDSETMAWANSRLMTEFFGEDWHCDMPTKPNPDYTYLCRIIKTVQEALKAIA